jgi:site-specific DNA-methyltransferase (adenine-specific)
MRYTHASGEIWNGDCLELMRNIPDGSIDMIITSPPYDNLRTYNGSLEWSFDIFKAIAVELSRIIKSGSVIVWNVADATVKGSETGTSFRQALYFKDECGLNLHDTMIYHKSSQPKQNGVRYEQNFEYMFVFSKGKRKQTELLKEPCKQAGRKTFRTSRDEGKEDLKRTDVSVSETKFKGNVWFYGSKENQTNHPAVFPVQLATDHILSWSNPGELILDPFGGSGTTAVAAHRTGRRSICIEKDLGYYLASCGRVWKEQQ